MLLSARKELREDRPFELEIVEMGISDPQATEHESCTNGRKDLDKDFLETPTEIAESLAKWLECNGVASVEFAKYIDRS